MLLWIFSLFVFNSYMYVLFKFLKRIYMLLICRGEFNFVRKKYLCYDDTTLVPELYVHIYIYDFV